VPRLARTLLVGGAALAAVSWWQRDALPAPEALDEALLGEPVQTPVERAPFEPTVAGVTYTVHPLRCVRPSRPRRQQARRRRVAGLAARSHERPAERHRPVRGLRRERAQRHLPAHRLLERAVRVLRRVALARRLAGVRHGGAPNNHLLADDPTIAKTLESARVGDQIHFRGYLAGYSHRHGFAFRRGTSTTRTDNGDGAYATEARIVRQGNRGWRAALWAGIATFVAGLFAWLAAPHGASDEASSLHGAANRH
jgi:hypothetical protein